MNRKILLIEDNEENRYLATFLLERRGWQVTPAHDGHYALEIAGDTAPALILLDIQLPGMDGYAVARGLRKNPRLDGVPIVAVTSYAMPGDRERCMEAGCDGYLEKPIDPDSFVPDVEAFALAGRNGTAP
jgi:two-component system, cell cycle response regulator DivK